MLKKIARFRIRIESFGWIRIQLNTDPIPWFSGSVWFSSFQSYTPVLYAGGGNVPIGRVSRRMGKYLEGREWRTNSNSWDWLVANPLRDNKYLLLHF